MNITNQGTDFRFQKVQFNGGSEHEISPKFGFTLDGSRQSITRLGEAVRISGSNGNLEFANRVPSASQPASVSLAETQQSPTPSTKPELLRLLNLGTLHYGGRFVYGSITGGVGSDGGSKFFPTLDVDLATQYPAFRQFTIVKPSVSTCLSESKLLIENVVDTARTTTATAELLGSDRYHPLAKNLSILEDVGILVYHENAVKTDDLSKRKRNLVDTIAYTSLSTAFTSMTYYKSIELAPKTDQFFAKYPLYGISIATSITAYKAVGHLLNVNRQRKLINRTDGMLTTFLDELSMKLASDVRRHGSTLPIEYDMRESDEDGADIVEFTSPFLNGELVWPTSNVRLPQ